jgi:protoporphyrinogen oxidase
MKERWAILGGGVMGIALAEQLVAHGQEVTILEAAPGIGGLASGWTVGDVHWDKYYHVTLLSDSKLRESLARIDLDDEIRWVTTKTGFYSGGQLHSMSNSWEFLKNSGWAAPSFTRRRSRNGNRSSNRPWSIGYDGLAARGRLKRSGCPC